MTDTALQSELIEMGRVDLEVTRAALDQEDHEAQLAWRRVTAAHAERLAEILEVHGWPGDDLVGREASQAAWKVAQHADHRLDVQRLALTMLAEAVAEGRAAARDLAFLTDRVRVNEGRRQVYGTQIAGVRDGRPVPWPLEEPERMEELRAAAGIESFAAQTGVPAA
ncbi:MULTISPECIES: DUF6624 domain-containing protein [Catenuloplanes]|uniref:Uncharacterized protein n=1 Tax=Catenuloplanes niger TaxID=587534 RepID=A0AAE4CXZ6_9ACTN|nr:DUF6624 domain-containing protein [Catenuloplanes niger]MDR7327972.1 hypothetical protein [Catenuloplanes niger]